MMRDSIIASLVLTGVCAALAVADPTSREIPDNSVTPGAVASENVCGLVNGISYSKAHRSNSYELRKSIRDRDHCDPHNNEVDHRVPLSLGGADTVENLWCQPGPSTNIVWNYLDKDKLEVYAWEQVCKQGKMSVKEAQNLFLGDWRKSYCVVFSDRRC